MRSPSLKRVADFLGVSGSTCAYVEKTRKFLEVCAYVEKTRKFLGVCAYVEKVENNDESVCICNKKEIE